MNSITTYNKLKIFKNTKEKNYISFVEMSIDKRERKKSPFVLLSYF